MLPHSHSSLFHSLTYALRWQFYTFLSQTQRFLPILALSCSLDFFRWENGSTWKRTAALHHHNYPLPSSLHFHTLSFCLLSEMTHPSKANPSTVHSIPSLSPTQGRTLLQQFSLRPNCHALLEHLHQHTNILVLLTYEKTTNPCNGCTSLSRLCPICLFPFRANFSKESSMLALFSSLVLS